MKIVENLSFLSLGIILVKGYEYLSNHEPFCFYLPGGIGKYYKVRTEKKITFQDVIGAEHIKKEISQHIQQFKDNKNTGKGFIFTGKKGLGKTFMSYAISGETDLPFIEIFPSREDHLSIIIQHVVKKYTPCIIFIDEGKTNLNILQKLESMENINGALLICATNKPVEPKKYLMDKVIQFSPPTRLERQLQMKKFGLSVDDHILDITNGFTQWDISVICREVSLGNNILTVINNMRYGRKTNIESIDDLHRRRLAYRQIGHLVMSVVLVESEKPNLIIIPENYQKCYHSNEDDIYLTRKGFLAKIYTILSQSVCEEMFLGDYSLLCESEIKWIKQNLNILREYYFIEKSDNQLIQSIRKSIKNILTKYQKYIENIYVKLIDQDTLNKDQISEMLGDIIDTENVKLEI